MSYYFNTILPKSDFEETVLMVREELTKQGFGVITEINVKDTFKNKLDVDFREYLILGACNPQFAHKAISLEDKIGVLLPCNIIVSKINSDEIEVSAVDPVASMAAVKNENLGPLAGEIRQKIKTVIDNLSQS